jgi:NTP pyrophosphatase (non-canonical NTP hydrolase)/Holliday junction resolvase RusA-like endonuclease
MNDTQATPGDSLRDLADLLQAFAQARNWEQYHTPKNLAMALAGEVGELVACFQWLTPGESARIMQDSTTAAAVESELADVLQYLIRLADVLEVDLVKAVRGKVQLNEKRFPPSLVPPPVASTPGWAGHSGKEPFMVLEVIGRPASYSSAAQGAWQAAVRAEIDRRHATPRNTRFGIRIAFRTPVAANGNEVWDIDNLVKPTLDAMEDVLGKRPWHGPAQAADDRVDYLEASKRSVSVGESPGAHVEVYDLGHDSSVI